MNKFYRSFHYNQRNSPALTLKEQVRDQTTLIMSVTLRQEFKSCFFKGHKKLYLDRPLRNILIILYEAEW